MKIKSSKKEVYHLLVYVEGATQKTKTFKKVSSLISFITKFEKKYPKVAHRDNWIDFYITNIAGDLVNVYEDLVE